MEQNPSWKANTSLAGQEIPRILWDSKFHHRFHKGLYLGSRLSIPLAAVTPRARPKLEDHSLPLFLECLLIYSQLRSVPASRLLCPQPEEAPRVVKKT